MKLRAKYSDIAETSNQFIGQILRMRGGEAQPMQPPDFSNLMKKFRKRAGAGGSVRLPAIGIDVLAKQGDLFHPLIDELSDFRNNILRTAGNLPPPGVRHHTV